MAALTAALALGTAAVGALSSKSAADKQSKAISSAAQGQQQAADEAAALQQQQYEQTRADNQPYTQAGYSALDELQKQLSTQPEYAPFNFDKTLDVSADAYKESPGLQTSLNRGISDLQSKYAAKGLIGSGAAAKGIVDYATGTRLQDYNDFRDYTTNEYNNDRNFAYQNYTDTTNRAINQRQSLLSSLYQIAGIGQNAASGTASAGASNANNQGNLLTSNADNQGQARIASADAQASGQTGLISSLTTAANRLGSSYTSPKIATSPVVTPTYDPSQLSTSPNVGRLSSSLPVFA